MTRPRLPPGQHITEGFPVLHAGSVPEIFKDPGTLEVYGEVEQPLTFNYKEFTALPAARINADIHCVTSRSKFDTVLEGVKFDTVWEGVKFKDLAALARPTSKARFVKFECEDGWTTSLPLADLMEDDVLLAYKYEEQDLSIEHGGPVPG